MTKSVLDQRPSGALRTGLRLPILLYKLHLGWLLGDRFMLLIHKGRKSGLPRRTVIEVVRHDRQANIYYAVSGWGKKADWYQNARAHPNVIIAVGGRLFEATAESVPLRESIPILQAYMREHPVAFSELSCLFLGQRLQSGYESAEWLASKMPMVAFCVKPEGNP